MAPRSAVAAIPTLPELPAWIVTREPSAEAGDPLVIVQRTVVASVIARTSKDVPAATVLGDSIDSAGFAHSCT